MLVFYEDLGIFGTTGGEVLKFKLPAWVGQGCGQIKQERSESCKLRPSRVNQLEPGRAESEPNQAAPSQAKPQVGPGRAKPGKDGPEVHRAKLSIKTFRPTGGDHFFTCAAHYR